MKRGWLWGILLVSVGVNVGILATLGTAGWRSDERPAGWHRDRAPRFTRFADHLELEGETRDEFLAIQQRLFDTSREGRERIETLRQELRRELMAERPDPERVEQMLGHTGELHQELDRALVESILATREILTPDQQERYFRSIYRHRSGGRRPGPVRPPAGARPPDAERQVPPREK